MNLITILILFLLFVFGFIKNRNLFLLSNFFHFFWFAIILLHSFRLFGLYTISNLTYMIIIVGNLAYYIGVRISCITMKKKYNNNFVYKKVKTNSMFKLLLTIALIIAFMKIYKMLPVILSDGIGTARNLMQVDDSLNLSGGLNVLLNYFVKPFLRIAIIYYLIEAFQNKVTKNKLFMIIIISLITFYIDGGRTSVMYFLISLVYIYRIYSYRLNRKNKRNILLSVIVVTLLLFYFTLARRVSVFENMYTYYSGSVVYLSENLSNQYLFGLQSGIGMNTFQGFLRPLFGILNLVGIPDPQILVEANDFLMGVQTTVTNISDTNTMNYFITAFGYAYSDYGMISVCYVFLITGFICGKIDKMKNDFFGLSMKILFFQGICFTMSYHMFGNYNFVMSMIFIIIINFSMHVKGKVKVS